MAAPKGHKRYGGRAKGTPNKRTSDVIEAVESICQKHNVDPIEGMCLLAKDKGVEPNIRFQCFKELASYIYAKRKWVEITGPEKGPVDVNNLGLSPAMQDLKQALEGYNERTPATSSKPQ